jgi:hypothetical protein
MADFKGTMKAKHREKADLGLGVSQDTHENSMNA